jgi:hypothetical protein
MAYAYAYLFVRSSKYSVTSSSSTYKYLHQDMHFFETKLSTYKDILHKAEHFVHALANCVYQV